MTKKKLLALCVLCALFCFTLGVLSDTAFAQNDSDSAKSIDKDLATKKGVKASLASKDPNAEEEDSRNPTKPQMFLGAGSCVVMIIVMKWL